MKSAVTLSDLLVKENRIVQLHCLELGISLLELSIVFY